MLLSMLNWKLHTHRSIELCKEAWHMSHEHIMAKNLIPKRTLKRQICFARLLKSAIAIAKI